MAQASRDTGQPGCGVVLGWLTFAAFGLLGIPALVAYVLMIFTGDVTSTFAHVLLVWFAASFVLATLGAMLVAALTPRPVVTRRRAVRILAVVVPYTLICGVAYVALAHDSFRRDLIATDFTSSAAPFPTGPQEGFSARTTDGTYEMVQQSPRPGASVSVGPWDGGTAFVDATVDVAPPPPGAIEPNEYGVGCVDLESRSTAIMLLVTPDGSGVRLATWWSSAAREALRSGPLGSVVPELETSRNAEPTAAVGPVSALRITCEREVNIGSNVVLHVVGYVNGAEVIRGGTAGSSAYGLALAFTGEAAGTTARFDDDHARHP
jgi:hypothetical protein